MALQKTGGFMCLLGASTKNVIFDLGGVLLNIDTSLTEQAFLELGYENFGNLFNLKKQTDLFNELEVGRGSLASFRQGICSLLGRNLSDKEIDRAWNCLLLDFPQERFDLLVELRKKYRVFLLSNTNKIHYDRYSQDFEERYGRAFSSMFNRMFLSYEMGHRKPDPLIYSKALETEGLEAGETVFIDDNAENAAAASAMGIKAHHLKEGEEVCSLF